MLMLIGQTDEKERDIALLTGEALAEPKVKELKGKKSGKPFTIVSLFCKVDGDTGTGADRTVVVEGWGKAGSDLRHFRKFDGIMCFGALYSNEYNGKHELRLSVGIGKTNFEPIVRISRGGVSTAQPIEAEPDVFTEIADQGSLPF